MTMSAVRVPTFEDLSAPAGGEIVAVANAAAARADHDDTVGELVIVARTASGDHRTVGGGRVGPLRAAISVAVAAGNYRLWRGAIGHDTIERPVRALPEIVRAAAEAAGVEVVHIGCIEDESVAAIAVWFEVDGRIADATERRDTMALLSTAAERQREFFAANAAAAAAAPKPQPEPSDDGLRSFDPDDPTLDAVTGLATRAQFEDAMNNYESDEATLVVVDLDDFESITDQYDEAITDAVLREIADRLVNTCRREDLIARLDANTFAILFADAPRSVGLHVAKRVLSTIALPLPVAGGPEVVTATVALSHQFGLVDMEELFESADHAVASGKRAGHGRLVIAS
jgi:diguanylate cyclase (GGDEF)-like protein